MPEESEVKGKKCSGFGCSCPECGRRKRKESEAKKQKGAAA